MSNRSTSASIVSLFLLAAVSALAFTPSRPEASQNGNSSTTVQDACASVTDPDIVNAIHTKIRANRELFRQRSHFNVSSKDRVVTLNGFVKGRPAVAKMGRLAKVRCVVRVKNKLGSFLRVGCGPGQKQCGDICIDEDAQCNPMGTP